jgi:MSHA biogenesis protein MshM
MYQAHFGLKELPFGLTPDTAYYCDHASHRDALNTVLLALRSGEGFVKLTGEIGLGKTLLCRQLLNQLSAGDSGFTVAYLPDPLLNAAGLRRAVLREFGLRVINGENSHDMMQRLQHFLIECQQNQQRPVVIVDEAQSLPDPAMEALRLLTNLETEKRKLLQVVLIGQPELNQRLNEHRLRQLRQRIAFSAELKPMDRHATGEYLQHRLSVAGHHQPGLFERRAIARIHQASRGVPRLINLLAHKSMLVAYGQGCARVASRHARAAVNDTDLRTPRQWPQAAAAALLLAISLSALLWWGGRL